MISQTLAFLVASGLYKAGPVGPKPSPIYAEQNGISYVIFGRAVFAGIAVQGRALTLYIYLDLYLFR